MRYRLLGLEYEICFNKKAFKSLCKEMKCKNYGTFINEGADATVHFFQKDGITRAVVCIAANDNTIEFLGLLCHECVHIWQELKRFMREDQPGDEVEAYMIQEIYKNLLKEAAPIIKLR